uniref:Transducin n=1 Tax=Timema genevievae TaxID=629358 RepID=A0A7R9JVE0_TIMGE|nr:unnamed protein product [Timema genevievae]
MVLGEQVLDGVTGKHIPFCLDPVPGTASSFHEGWDAVVGLGIACSGKFIMSCSDKTELVLWDLKGQQLAKVDTYLMNNYCARISPCGRFVAASGFTPDVKVWEVCFAKTGEFHQVSRAFELSGHSSGVYDFSFNADSSRIATVSKDGTWKAYNTKTDGGSLSFYSVLTGECDNTIRDIYSGGALRILLRYTRNPLQWPNGDIVCVQFDSLGKFVLAAGDKHVHVFHNVTGYRATIASIQAKFKQATMSSAQKERMEQQIQEAQDFLKGLKEQSS